MEAKVRFGIVCSYLYYLNSEGWCIVKNHTPSFLSISKHLLGTSKLLVVITTK